MMQRWYIQRGQAKEGPLSSAEIKAQLLSGDIDPFDFVLREGSPIKRPLLEDDTIFAAEAESHPAEKKHAAGFGAPVDSRIVRDLPATNVSSVMETSSGVPQDKYVPAARPAPPVQSQFEDAPLSSIRRKDPKKYFLVDERDVILGPMAAGEIEMMFYRGIIHQDVHVRKNGSSTTVPVNKFVTVYAAAKTKGGQPGNGIVQAQMTRGDMRGMTQVAHGRQAHPKVGLFVARNHLFLKSLVWVLMVLAVAGSFFFLYRYGEANNWQLHPRPYIDNEPSRSSEAVAPASTNQTVQPAARQLRDAEASAPRPSEASRSRSSRTPRSSGPSYTPPPSRSYTALPSPSARPRPISPRVPVASSTPRTTSANTGPFIEGAMVSGLRVTYSVRALDQCPVKCQMAMRDSHGRAITAVFFKGAYYQKLRSRGGSAEFTGRIGKGPSGFVIYPQDVR